MALSHDSSDYSEHTTIIISPEKTVSNTNLNDKHHSSLLAIEEEKLETHNSTATVPETLKSIPAVVVNTYPCVTVKQAEQIDFIRDTDVKATHYEKCQSHDLEQKEENKETISEEKRSETIDKSNEEEYLHPSVCIDTVESNPIVTDSRICHKDTRETNPTEEYSNCYKSSTLARVEAGIQTSPINIVNDTVKQNPPAETDSGVISIVSKFHDSENCDIVKSTTDLKLQMTPNPTKTVDAGIQVTSDLEPSQLPPLLGNINTSTDPIFKENIHPSIDAGIQVELDSSQELNRELSDLRQELETAQNTLIWQSMMLKLYQLH